jgi:hypothetical protein
MRSIFLIIVLCSPLKTFGLGDTAIGRNLSIKMEAYIDLFYSFDFNQPGTGIRQSFLCNHNRHNEINLNHGYLKLSAEEQRFKANLALQAGTYVQDNYATEPGALKNILEANVGVLLSKKKNIWFDAGIFPSHIGFESAGSLNNWTLTRSLLAENSPYYLAGARLSFAPNPNWEVSALVCNGWQRIQKIQGNSLLSAGSQVKYFPTKKIILNWSTFAGSDQPDSLRKIRYFNNFYGQLQISRKLGIIAGLDLGFQQKNTGSTDYQTWYSPVIIVQYAMTEKFKMAFRGESYQDASGIIVRSQNTGNFNASGFSVNFDYAPESNYLFRLEGRWLHSPDQMFENGSKFLNNSFSIVASVTALFSHSAARP